MARLTIGEEVAGSVAPAELCSRLETGDILYFPVNPIPLDEADRAFLVSQKQGNTHLHKNISYRPVSDRLRGADAVGEDLKRTHAIIRRYSQNAVAFMTRFFPQYARDWRIDFASFRPLEEEGRKASQRARNDLIHIDSFPSRPSHGDRLLRIFSNLNATRPRVWVTSESFEQLARKYAGEVGLPHPPTALSKLRVHALKLLSEIGLPVVNRPAYDQFMLRFHHFLKESGAFQRDCPKERWEFPPNSTWICFTDTTSHSCISGQYAVEQTFIVRSGSLVCPEKSPMAILERMAGFPLEGGYQAKSA
jgi:hypothetical protein